MTPQAVATAAKAIAPQNPPAQAPAASTIDFSQLLGGGFASLLQASNSNTTPPAPPPQASPPKHNSSDTDSASANLAGTACAAAPQQQTQAATSPYGPSGGAIHNAEHDARCRRVFSRNARRCALPALPQAAATNGASGTTSGQGAQTVPGAAAVEARVVAGAPTYLSQPSAMLAGLWHHAGAAQANDADARRRHAARRRVGFGPRRRTERCLGRAAQARRRGGCGCTKCAWRKRQRHEPSRARQHSGPSGRDSGHIRSDGGRDSGTKPWRTSDRHRHADSADKRNDDSAADAGSRAARGRAGRPQLAPGRPERNRPHRNSTEAGEPRRDHREARRDA